MENFEFDYIGENEDIINFIQDLAKAPFSITSLEQTSVEIPKITSFQGQEEQKTSTRKQLPALPPNEDVLAYIISKPNYAHTLYDVQKHFFKRTFITTDKTTIGMYLKTNKQLKEVRGEIEKRYHGKFDKKRGLGRLDYFSFKKEE